MVAMRTSLHLPGRTPIRRRPGVRSIVLLALAVGALVGAPTVLAGRTTVTPLVENGTFSRKFAGWTLSAPQFNCGGVQRVVLVRSKDTKPSPVVDGVAAWLNGCGGTPKPSVTQTVTLEQGTEYHLTGLVAMEGGGSLGNFQIAVDGSVVSYTTGDATPAGWTPFGHTFTASGTTVTLAFTAEVGGDVSAYLDTIALVPTTP
ncbi:MAG: hypothetical protein RL338_914 [Chloroflexota bacterium]